MEKHLGGVIHLVDSCDMRVSTKSNSLPTFRPKLVNYVSDNPWPNVEKETPNKRKKPIGNRRMDYGDDYAEFDEKDEASKLLEKCRQKQNRKRNRRESDAKISGMPVFEHFPMRNIEIRAKQNVPIQTTTTRRPQVRLPTSSSSFVEKPKKRKRVNPPQLPVQEEDDFESENECQQFEALLLNDGLSKIQATTTNTILTPVEYEEVSSR